jgi:hypothetical protein
MRAVFVKSHFVYLLRALLCDIAMDGDRGIAEVMGLKLELGETIAQGCPACKLHFHK